MSKRAEEALARARKAVADQTPKKPEGGRWLALIPVTIGVVMMALMMPRATEPDAVPVPTVDTRALHATMHHDDELAAKAKAERLPTDVLAVGTGVRDFQFAQQHAEPSGPEGLDRTVTAAAARLDEARRALGGRQGWEQDLLELRATQMSAFLEEIARYEKTGESTKDLEELGGGFVKHLETWGWMNGKRILLDEPQRRASFKVVWNTIVGVEVRPLFQLTLDEQRALYTLYLTRPHASEMSERSIVSLRKADQCGKALIEERHAREMWRAEKIKKLGAIDPTYPTDYAVGVSMYRAGNYELATDAFRTWLDAHPEGPWSARARNHLKASIIAAGAI